MWCMCRHGARSPLTLKYWDGAQWDKDTLCGQQFSAVQLSLTAMGGGPRPDSVHDKRQVLPGLRACTFRPGDGRSTRQVCWKWQLRRDNVGPLLRHCHHSPRHTLTWGRQGPQILLHLFLTCLSLFRESQSAVCRQTNATTSSMNHGSSHAYFCILHVTHISSVCLQQGPFVCLQHETPPCFYWCLPRADPPKGPEIQP